MNLQNLQKIGTPKSYFETAIRQSKKRVLKRLPKHNLSRIKVVEIERIRDFTKILNGNLITIEKSFPSAEDLDPFYFELIENNVGIINLKTRLSKIKGSIRLINNLEKQYSKRISAPRNIAKIKEEKGAFFGRINSILKTLKGDLESLEQIRQKLRKLPTIKTNIDTVCISGYPNVGKSTLLTRLTTAKPEINIYPFTTKRIMIGYIGKKQQIIDTPGIFRDTEDMNSIEKQSYLVIKHLAKIIVFVIDTTESCGYTLKSQEELLSRIKKEFKDKKLIIYASKSDLMNKEQLEELSEKQIVFDSTKLKKMLLEK